MFLTPKPSLAVCLKVEELKETVKEEFMPWVSQYLVMKRVSIEPNFHSLYSNFLDTLKNPEFVKMVLNETYRNIKVNFFLNSKFKVIQSRYSHVIVTSCCPFLFLRSFLPLIRQLLTSQIDPC